MNTEKIKAGYRFVIEDTSGKATSSGLPASLSRIPNPPSAFILNEGSKGRMRQALERHVAVSKKQYGDQMLSAS